MSLENEIKELTSAVRALNDNLHAFLHQQKPVPQDEPEKAEETPVAEPAEAPAADPVDKPAPAKRRRRRGSPPPAQATKQEVVAALKALQAARDAGTVKALLKQHGATGMANLAEGKYADVLAAAGALLAEETQDNWESEDGER